MPSLQVLSSSQVSPEVPVNENFETLSAVGIFGKRQPATSGLTWAYYGGFYNGNTIADGTVALTNNATNYVSVLRSSGVVSVSTATTNWTDASYAQLYKVVTSAGAVTTVEDHRTDSNGLFGASGSVGKHAIFIPAGAMQPSVSGGCAALATVASGAGQPDLCTLDFDASSQEFAQFAIAMPKSWNEGTVTFRPIWSHAATATNFGAVWQLQGLAVSDNEAIGQAFGTAQTSTDVGGTTNNQYRGPESAAITIAGTPAAEDTVFFRVGRVPADGSDTLAIDARLHGIVLYITTDAGTDA
jgi:hypothetical protein